MSPFIFNPISLSLYSSLESINKSMMLSLDLENTDEGRQQSHLKSGVLEAYNMYVCTVFSDVTFPHAHMSTCVQIFAFSEDYSTAFSALLDSILINSQKVKSIEYCFSE